MVDHQLAMYESIKQFLTPKCFEAVFEQGKIDQECLKLFISKGLSLGIIAGAVVVKIPQLLTILNMQSSKGLSSTSYFLETLCGSIAVVYNMRHGHPFTTYGESVFLTIQNCIILILILVLERKNLSALLHFIAVAGFTSWWMSVGTPISVITWFLTLSVPVVVLSRLPQIYLIWKEQNRGAVNPITVLLTFLGSSARLFTQLQEVGDDKLVLISSSLLVLVNGILALQVLCYPKAPKASKSKKD